MPACSKVTVADGDFRGILLAYGTLLLVLAVYKARAVWKESAGLKGLEMVKVLIRDQAVYFLAWVDMSHL